MSRIITNSMIGDFESYLRSDEKSKNTIEKYLRVVRAFTVFAEEKTISKTVVSLRIMMLMCIQKRRKA